MDIDKKIKEVLDKGFLIKETNFAQQFKHYYKGKVRDNYSTDDERVIIVSDRLSAFDRVITLIPYKGQVLNQIAAFWFQETSKEVPNHVIKVPDPNIMIVKECEPIPVEMVIRGYITGSAWRAYQKDQDVKISGIKLPSGLKKHQEFEGPIITPSTKASSGHDEPISKDEILNQGIVEKEIYLKMEEYTKKLFSIGTDLAARHGLILVDTKYEFGIDREGNLVVIDEIHTPDSSRYWMKSTYEERFNAGMDPEILDKEFIRDWLRIEKGFMGDGEIPPVDEDIKISLCKRYIKNYEILTGLDFNLSVISPDDHPLDRIRGKLVELGYLK
ncbi:phosphoribosylaminoimidazolesuccinocarboxamide synthase [Candidatus Bathyarchaeota archaeon]|nr:phosphoribosylaminoimidazolesuccinocarboxamide synthase [Candidatus Bathyarchaeota archaeon]